MVAANLYEFEVHRSDLSGMVNLRDKTCLCCAFKIDKYLCVHAFAVCKDHNINVYSLCDPFFSNKIIYNAYLKTIHLLGDPKQWHAPDAFFASVVLPPRFHKNGMNV